jgi:hypothetical protein
MANNVLAYGFVGLEALMADRIVNVNMEVLNTAITTSVQEHTRQVNAIMSTFVERTTKYSERYLLKGAGTLQPQDLSGFGNPLPVIEAGYYDVAFPMQAAATAWGENHVARAKMTVAEANRYTLEAIDKDSNWMTRHFLASVFDNAAWTFVDPFWGSLTIRPLALASDSITYPFAGGAMATDTHHIYQAAAIADATNPFGTIYDELMEHPSNSGPVVCYIPNGLVTSVRGLTNFIPVQNPMVRYGIGTDTYAGPMAPGVGEQVLGTVDQCEIVEWRALPANYIFAHAQGAGPIVKMREDPEPELQGFFPEFFDTDGNTKGVRMRRRCGFGVTNRVGAVVMEVSNGSYAIPTGYDAPLSV